MSSKRVCPNCGRKMKQQFIGLFHCKCGLSWKRDIGFFERTPNMVFALERIQAGKKVKQVPVIIYKQPIEGDTWQNQRLKNCQAKISRLKSGFMVQTVCQELCKICGVPIFVLEIVPIEYIMLTIYRENADALRIEFHKSLRIILSRR